MLGFEPTTLENDGEPASLLEFVADSMRDKRYRSANNMLYSTGDL
jgi:hypothetical protein